MWVTGDATISRACARQQRRAGVLTPALVRGMHPAALKQRGFLGD